MSDGTGRDVLSTVPSPVTAEGLVLVLRLQKAHPKQRVLLPLLDAG